MSVVTCVEAATGWTAAANPVASVVMTKSLRVKWVFGSKLMKSGLRMGPRSWVGWSRL